MNAIFFPRNDYPNKIEVCAHRLGKKMTYTDCTDQFRIGESYGSYEGITALAKARGIKLSFFGRNLEFGSTSFENVIKPDIESGAIWADMYSWTISLSEKLYHGDDITEEEWNYAYNNELLPLYFNALGKKPLALSYSYGNDSFKDYVIPKYLGARCSGSSRDTSYGVGYGSPNNIPYSISHNKSLGATFRWWDEAKTQGNYSEVIGEVASKIDETIASGGWIVNFTHYHSVYQEGTQQVYEDYLDMLAAKNVNGEIYFAGYGEALAYLVFRQIITKVVMYSPIGAENDKLIIRLETKNNLNIDTDLLQIPISVKFSTAGTPLEGQNIKCSHNLISLGNNQYIVEIPYFQYPAAIIDKLSI